MSNSNWNRTFMTAKQPGKKAKNRRPKKTKFFLALLILMALGIGNLPAHAATTLTTVDREERVGGYTSLALNSSGYPIISYYDNTNYDLKVAVCNDATCTSKTLTTVDNGGDVGYFTSLALNSSGYPVISYYDNTNSALKVAVCNDATCTSPTLTTVDSGGDVGGDTSLALNSSGYPVISYFDYTNSALKVAVCNDATCTSKTLTTVDNGGDVGWYTSLALNSDKPVISYYDSTNYDLKVAVCNDATCTSPTLTTVDSGGDVGYYTSLALNSSGYPVISYSDYTNYDLKVAVCNDATCTSPTLTTVDSGGDVGAYTSLALNSSGYPVISYSDYTNYDLKVAVCNDATCTSPTLTTVDNGGSVGYYTSLALNSSGYPVISYYDSTNVDLKVAVITPPTVTSLTRATGAANPTNATSVDFTVTFSDDVTGVDTSDFTVRANGATGTVSAVSGSGKIYNVKVTTTSEGSLGLDVKTSGTDIQSSAGNALAGGYTNGEAYTIDKTGPVTTLTSTSKPTDPSNVATASFEFNSDESTATFECKLDTGGWATCVSPKPLSGLADGSHTFEVRAKDTLGNTDATPESYTWTVDTTGPVTTLTSTSKPTDPSNVATASFEFSSDDQQATFECKLDTGGWAACNSPHALSGLADGSHTFEVRAKDTLGNTDATPESYTWVVDTTAPVTTLTSTSKPTDPSNVATASFEFSSDDQQATFECQLDKGGWAVCTSQHTLSSLADGSHTFEVRAKDTLGNTDATPESYTWTVDTTAPSTTLTSTSKPTNPSNVATASFEFSSDDQQATFECQLDTGGWAVCVSPKPLSSLADGSHTFEVRAKDTLGNTDATPESYTWVVDTTAPSTTLTRKPTDPSNVATASFEFSSDDSTATFECKLDTGGWAVCTSQHTLSSLADGSHTFEVRAEDTLGNTDATPESYTWVVDTTVVDTTAPSTTLTKKPTNPSNVATASFEFSSDDSTATFECQLDKGGWAVCTSQHTLSSLADGSHTFEVRAKDAAGNVDATPESYTWVVDTTVVDTTVVDTTAPSTTFTRKPTDPSNVATASFEFSSDDSTATFECKLDTGGWAVCTSQHTLSSLADGSHTFEVRAKDAAGNVDATPDQYPWTITTVYVAPSPTSTPTATATATASATTVPTASATPSPTAPSSPTPSPTSVASTGKSRLQIGIRGPKQVSRGQAARFTLTYSNTGSVTATEVVIKLPLPPYTTFDKANSTPGWALTKTVSLQAGQLMATGSVTATSETYVLAVGDLAPGQSGSATFATTVQADAPADLTLNVEASIGDSTSTGSTTTAKSNTTVEVVDKIKIYLPLILR